MAHEAPLEEGETRRTSYSSFGPRTYAKRSDGRLLVDAPDDSTYLFEWITNRSWKRRAEREREEAEK